MPKKRILYISNLYPNPSSPNMAAFSKQQIQALNNFADIDVIAPIPWTARLRAKIPYHYVSNGKDVHHPTYYYTPGILRSLYGQFYLSSIRRTAEKLLNSKKYDFIYASWLFPDGWAATHLAEKYKIPMFIKIVGTDINRLCIGGAVTQKSLWAVDRAERVISVSAKLKECLVALGADSNKIEVVYSGVDLTVFHPMDRQQVRAEMGVPLDRKIVLYVGNIKKEKGVIELVEAFAGLVRHYPNMALELIIIGSGPFEQQMRNALDAEKISDRVRFIGSKPLEEVAKWMNACNVFCLPTYMEGLPNVVIEALACQAKIVATNVGGIPEIDEGQINLRLIDPQSVSQLELALDEMLSLEIEPFVSKHTSSWLENAAHVFSIFQGKVYGAD